MKNAVLFILLAFISASSTAQQKLLLNPVIGKTYVFTAEMAANDDNGKRAASVSFEFIATKINDSGNYLINVWLKHLAITSFSKRDTTVFDSDKPQEAIGAKFSKKDRRETAAIFAMLGSNPITLEISKVGKIAHVRGIEVIINKYDTIANSEKPDDEIAEIENQHKQKTIEVIEKIIPELFSHDATIYGRPLQAGDKIEANYANKIFKIMHWPQITIWDNYFVSNISGKNVVLEGTKMFTYSTNIDPKEKDSLPNSMKLMIDSIEKIKVGTGTSIITLNKETGLVESGINEYEFYKSKMGMNRNAEKPNSEDVIKLKFTTAIKEAE